MSVDKDKVDAVGNSKLTINASGKNEKKMSRDIAVQAAEILCSFRRKGDRSFFGYDFAGSR